MSSSSVLWKLKPEGDEASCILEAYLLLGNDLQVIHGSAM